MPKRSRDLARLSERLKAIPKAVITGTIPAVLSAAEEIASIMRHLAPVKSGRLRT